MKKLSKEQILMLHAQLIQQTGGSDGVRDYNLLDSALETPFQSFGGDELYPIIQFLALNGIELSYTQKELYEMILSVASGNMEYEDLLQWVLELQN